MAKKKHTASLGGRIQYQQHPLDALRFGYRTKRSKVNDHTRVDEKLPTDVFSRALNKRNH